MRSWKSFVSKLNKAKTYNNIKNGLKNRQNNTYSTSNIDVEENPDEDDIQEKQYYTPPSYKEQVKDEVKSTGEEIVKRTILKKILVLLTSKFVLIGLLIIVVFVILVTIFITVFEITGNSSVMGGYYAVRCSEVTVIMTDKKNGYAPTGTKTIPLEQYVAGVVAGEVGYLGSIEVDKAFAVAATSYMLTHDDGNCTIESSDRKQVYRDLTNSPTDQMALEAAKETLGQVLLKGNDIYGTQYDAFACIAKDSNYYTISQANQKIPVGWVNQRITKSSWLICNGRENMVNHHGNGMSQFGALYLATEQGYTYDQIIDFYLGDKKVKISQGGYTTEIGDLSVKNTTNAKNLNEPLGTFLSKRGSSIEELNKYIADNVDKNGRGTRAGVVTAAVSLINFLNDNYSVSIPYYWGGNYQRLGVSPNFGGSVGTSCSSNKCYSKAGFDCSGFVSWAIKNGGYNISRLTTMGFDSQFGNNSCNIINRNCKGQPGDLINSRNCHVQMIVAVDEKSKKYIVAEATGGYGVIMREVNMHRGNCGLSETKIIYMNNFYNNKNNVG